MVHYWDQFCSMKFPYPLSSRTPSTLSLGNLYYVLSFHVDVLVSGTFFSLVPVLCDEHTSTFLLD